MQLLHRHVWDIRNVQFLWPFPTPAMGKKDWPAVTLENHNSTIWRLLNFACNNFSPSSTLHSFAPTGWTTSTPSLCSGHRRSTRSTRSLTTTAERSSRSAIGWWRRRRSPWSANTSIIVSARLLKTGRWGSCTAACFNVRLKPGDKVRS